MTLNFDSNIVFILNLIYLSFKKKWQIVFMGLIEIYDEMSWNPKRSTSKSKVTSPRFF
jgi:hypothetical protein